MHRVNEIIFESTFGERLRFMATSKQQNHTGTKSGNLYGSLPGDRNVSELIEISTGTWEVHTIPAWKAV
jgi:hypothetical protein